MISVYPKYINVKYWAACVCDDYSDFPLPVLHDAEKWAIWAQTLVGIEPFLNAGVPSPFKLGREKNRELAFKSWEEWAKKAYLIMLEYSINQT